MNYVALSSHVTSVIDWLSRDVKRRRNGHSGRGG